MTMLGFVLIPDKKVLHESINLNNQISGSQLQLDDTYFLPHVTVLQARIRGSFNHRNVLEEARTYPGFKHELQTATGVIYQSGKYIMWGLENASWLTLLNQTLVQVASPHITVPEPTLPFADKHQEESYLATGYTRNLKAYEPHITLGVLKDNTTTELPQTPVKTRINFRQLLFTEHSEYGAIKRIIDSHPLPARWD